MKRYLGYIDKRQNFYNFFPLGLLDEITGELTKFTEPERRHLFSDRGRYNYINLYFKDFEIPEDMYDLIHPMSLVVLEFDDSETPHETLQHQYSSTFSRYSVNAADAFEEDELYEIDNVGYFVVLDERDLQGDFNGTRTIRISDSIDYLQPGSEIYVRLNDSDILSGPYRVSRSDAEYRGDPYLYIQPELRENKYLVNGLKNVDTELFTLTSGGYEDEYRTEVELLRNPQNYEAVQLDLVTNEQLLNDFKRALEHSAFNIDGSVQIRDFNEIIRNDRDSLLTTADIPKEFQKERFERIYGLLTSEEDLNTISRNLNDYFIDIIEKNIDSRQVDEFVRFLLSRNSDFLNRIQKVKVIQNSIDQLYAREQEIRQQVDSEKQALEDLHREMEEFQKESEQIRLQYSEEIKSQELLELERKIEEKTREYEELEEKFGRYQEVAALDLRKLQLEAEIHSSETIINYIKKQEREVKEEFEAILNEQSQRMLSQSYDGYVASQMLNAASRYENEQNARNIEQIVEAVYEIPAEIETTEQMIDYLVSTIQIERPSYTKNTILNLLINLSQNLLTVLAGDPGTGKTSISHILGRVLGLEKIDRILKERFGDEADYSRYIPVSVEKGWTSKRDLVGYYNPLSKKFDKANQSLFNALNVMDIELKTNRIKYPTLVLLDEANLSPMEYYWSDFMRLSDADPHADRSVSLGENYVYQVPDSFHYIATINNDQTTEPLSARLIDRSSIIILPYPSETGRPSVPISDEQVRLVPWSLLQESFVPEDREAVFSPQVAEIYQQILDNFRRNKIVISPRLDRSIRRYWSVAHRYFDGDSMGSGPEIVALDYAVAQKLLPKINGPVDALQEGLENLLQILESNGLNASSALLQSILEQGQSDLYYHFF